MKKKFLVTLVSAMALMLCACGSTDSKSNAAEVISEEVVAKAAPEEVSTESAEEIVSEEASTEEATTEEVVEEITDDWLSNNSYHVSPKDSEPNLVIEQYAKDEEGNYTPFEKPTFEAPISTIITESTEGCDPGYKEMTFEYVVDLKDYEGDQFTFQMLAFDRYNGTVFEIPSDLKMGNYYDFTLENEEGPTDLKISKITKYNGSNKTYRGIIRAICPEDYDNIVLCFSRFDISRISDVETFTSIDEHNEAYLKERSNNANEVVFFSASDR